MRCIGSDDMVGQLLASFFNVYPKQIRAWILLPWELPAELEQSENFKMAFLQHHFEGIHVDRNCICWCSVLYSGWSFSLKTQQHVAVLFHLHAGDTCCHPCAHSPGRQLCR